jgi:hypothetical protein
VRRRVDGLGAQPVAVGVDALDRRVRKTLLRALESDERPLFCVRAPAGQAIAALPHRLLIVKVGPSGTWLGAKVASYRYEGIAAITIQPGEVNSVVEVAPLRGRPRREWWHSWIAFEDPLRAATTLVIPTEDIEAYEAVVERLRELVAASRERSASAGPSGDDLAGDGDLVTSLERLSALHAAGALTDAEFARAKQTLLG